MAVFRYSDPWSTKRRRHDLRQFCRTSFSVDRGFYDSPFSLEVSTETNGATIRYTLDGTLPTTGYGTVYSDPIQIDGTSFVRAIAYKPGWLPTNVDTVTYIFIQDTINQLPNNNPPGPGWPNSGYAGDQVQVQGPLLWIG